MNQRRRSKDGLRQRFLLRRRFLHAQQEDLDRAAAVGDPDRALRDLIGSMLERANDGVRSARSPARAAAGA